MNHIKKNNKKIPKVAIVGRPNVGKSTLFNKLSHSRRALVAPVPGVTRDIQAAEVDIENIPVRLVDTGGIGEAGNELLSQLVTDQAKRELEDTDLIIFLVDAKDGLLPSDRDIFYQIVRPSKRPYLLVANKVDGSPDSYDTTTFFELGVDDVIPISAEHSRGLGELREKVAQSLISSFGKEIVVNKEGDIDAQEDVQLSEAEKSKEDKVEPVRVALVGRPNVGKSSLINKLLGMDRMIVSDIPGTTRDAVDSLLVRPDGPPIIFTDTAGIRRKAKVKEKVEKFSVIKTLDAIKNSDIALVILDPLEGITDQDKRIMGYAEDGHKAIITVFNKWDLMQSNKELQKKRGQELRMAKRFCSYAPHINVSALTGRGIKKILPLIDRVYAQYSATFPTSQINKVLQESLLKRTPPIHKGHHLKMYYATQVSSKPPTILIFANYPKYIPEQYKRFLANRFREELSIPESPIRLIFRERERKTYQ